MLQKLKSKLQPSSDGIQAAKLALRLSLEVAEQALDGLPLPGAKLTIVALLAIIKGVEKSSRNTGALEQLTEHIRYLCEEVVMPVCDSTRHADINTGWRAVLEKLTSDLDAAIQPWKNRGQHGLVRRFLDANDWELDLQDLVSGIRLAIERYQLSSQVRGELAMTRIEKNTLHIGAQLKNQQLVLDHQETIRLINSLPRASTAAFDAGQDGERTSCLVGTRISVLAQINTWLENVKCPPVFWLNGLAGTGKTTIARTIAEGAHARGQLGASFFCSSLLGGALSDPKFIFPTLAFQLAQRLPRFRNALSIKLAKDPDLGHRDIEAQLLGLIVQPLADAGAEDDDEVTLIVLDALDECLPERDTAQIIRLVLKHVSSAPSLRVVISSRPEHHIRTLFTKSCGHYDQLALHEIEESAVRNDIKLFLRTELAAVPDKLNLDLPATGAGAADAPSWPREADVSALTAKAGHLFVYAATAVRFVAHDRIRNPRRQMDVLLGMRSAAHANPYAHLDRLYLHLLHSALPEDVEVDDVDRFRRVVGTIMCAREPLSVVQLARFTGDAVADVVNALYHLHSVIVTPPCVDGPPRIYHPSFADFITDSARCSERFVIRTRDIESRLTSRCFRVMGAQLRRGVEREAIPSDLYYACRYWALHLSACSLGDSEASRSVEEFVFTGLICWFEVLSHLNLVSYAPFLIKQAHSWTIQSTCKVQVMTILEDGYRFALANQDVMKDAPEHVYLSALPFTPPSCLLFKTYEHEGIDGVIVLHPMTLHWSPLLSTTDIHSNYSKPSAHAFMHHGSTFAISDQVGHATFFNTTAPALMPTSTSIMQQTCDGKEDGTVSHIVFSPDGRKLACSRLDTTEVLIDVWDITLATSLGAIREISTSKPVLGFSSDNGRLAFTSIVGGKTNLHIVNTSLLSHPTLLSAPIREASCLTYVESSSDTHIALGCKSGAVLLCRESSSSVLFSKLDGHCQTITSFASCKSRSILASGSQDLKICVWDMDDLTLLHTLESHQDPVTSLTFNVDGSQLASGSSLGDLILWNSSSSFSPTAEVEVSSGHAVQSIAYSLDGLSLHTFTEDGYLKQWHPVDLEKRKMPSGRKRNESAAAAAAATWLCAFNDDASLIALAHGGKTCRVRIWNGRTGAPLRECDAGGAALASASAEQEVRVSALALSKDGARVAAACSAYSSVVHVWSTGSGQLVCSLNLVYIGLRCEAVGLTIDRGGATVCAYLMHADPGDTTSSAGDEQSSLHAERVFVPPAPAMLSYNLSGGGAGGMPVLLPSRGDVPKNEDICAWTGDDGSLFMRLSDLIFEEPRLIARLPTGTVVSAFGHCDRVVCVGLDGSICILDISNFLE